MTTTTDAAPATAAGDVATVEPRRAPALANQLVASFIPAVPGWVATKDLMNRDYL